MFTVKSLVFKNFLSSLMHVYDLNYWGKTQSCEIHSYNISILYILKCHLFV